jgi:hypothetical protein
LVSGCKKLPGFYVMSGTEGKDIYNPRITHMICPPETKTLKTLAAILSGAWIITDPEWILESVLQKKVQEEGQYGFRCEKNPITGKTLYLSPEFKELCQDKTKPSHQWIKFMELLWIECSKGTIVQTDDADYTMVPDGVESDRGEGLTWHQFMTMIPTK